MLELDMFNSLTKWKNAFIRERKKQHFKERCIERVGRALTEKEHDDILRKIKLSLIKPIGKLSRKGRRYIIKINKKKYVIVHDKRTCTLTTIIPRGWRGAQRLAGV